MKSFMKSGLMLVALLVSASAFADRPEIDVRLGDVAVGFNRHRPRPPVVVYPQPYPVPYPAPAPYPYPAPAPYPYPAPYPQPYPQPYMRSDEVRCDSNDKRYDECDTNLNQLVSIQLLDQKSNADCIQGRSFGITGRRVWVDRGCRGRFLVTGY